MKSSHSEAIDLSLKHNHNYHHKLPPEPRTLKSPTVLLLKPEPRPAWSILWYRTIWPKLSSIPQTTFDLEAFPAATIKSVGSIEQDNGIRSHCEEVENEQLTRNSSDPLLPLETVEVDLSLMKQESSAELKDTKPTKSSLAITDVATCDGPVHFQRISNPNFALTVEHRERSQCSDIPLSPLSLPANSKTYICIYCNQTFKSLFCYQKHKKRHLNPVPVDITPHPNLELTHSLSENTLRTAADLNVQFFPCKNCGSKFPSYYFVHKHKKVCDKREREQGEPTVVVDSSAVV